MDDFLKASGGTFANLRSRAGMIRALFSRFFLRANCRKNSLGLAVACLPAGRDQ